jgi:hypothetical protein
MFGEKPEVLSAHAKLQRTADALNAESAAALLDGRCVRGAVDDGDVDARCSCTALPPLLCCAALPSWCCFM